MVYSFSGSGAMVTTLQQVDGVLLGGKGSGVSDERAVVN